MVPFEIKPRNTKYKKQNKYNLLLAIDNLRFDITLTFKYIYKNNTSFWAVYLYTRHFLAFHFLAVPFCRCVPDVLWFCLCLCVTVRNCQKRKIEPVIGTYYSYMKKYNKKHLDYLREFNNIYLKKLLTEFACVSDVSHQIFSHSKLDS